MMRRSSISRRWRPIAAASLAVSCLGQPQALNPAEEIATQSTTEPPSTSSDDAGPSCELPDRRCNAVDVLFIIDNSGSMTDDIGRVFLSLQSNIEDLFHSITDRACSYHIGITTTSADPDFQPEECRLLGALSRGGALVDQPIWTEDRSPWISELDDEQQALADFTNLIYVGQYYDNNERQLETLLNAIGPDLLGPGGCNEGFIREGVPLLVILVTDEDDDNDQEDDDELQPEDFENRTGSEGTPEQWFRYLSARKPVEEFAMVVVAATQADPGARSACTDWQPDVAGEDGTGAEYAKRILEFLTYFSVDYSDHIHTIDLCEPGLDLVAELDTIDALLTTLCANP